MTISVTQGDCVEVLRARIGPLFDSAVTDPPYELGFMGRAWDASGVAFRVETWRAVFDQLKPGAHLVAFSGTRTYHRMVVAIEDAGFEIRDQLAWCYGSGFPKSLDVSKAIDKAAGAEREVLGTVKHRDIKNGNGRGYGDGINAASRGAPTYIEHEITAPGSPEAVQWQGWGTALKPAWEPICLARKPLISTVAANVLAHGTGGLNIDACRVEGENTTTKVRHAGTRDRENYRTGSTIGGNVPTDYGRFPANLLHDGSEEVEALFPTTTSGSISPHHIRTTSKTAGVFGKRAAPPEQTNGDTGSAARFFASHSHGELDLWTAGIANYAGEPLSLQSEAVVTALSHAVAKLMPGSELQKPSYRAPNMNVSASELKRVCALAIEMIQSFAEKFWRGSPPSRLTLTSDLAESAAILGPIDTIAITIDRWRSNGSADPVTFALTLPSADRGAQGFEKRAFYSAKAGPLDRLGSEHATIKPVDLMRWLVRLVTPPGGLVLDPFAGSGTTGIAALAEKFNAELIDLEADHVADIETKLAYLRGEGGRIVERHLKRKATRATTDDGGLFGGML